MMFTAIEQMKVKLDKQHKTLGVIQNMVEGLQGSKLSQMFHWPGG